MPVLIDTNILPRSVQRTPPVHLTSLRAVDRAHRIGAQVHDARLAAVNDGSQAVHPDQIA